MKLSRRSFFGLFPAAAVGGKAALKEAAAKAAEGLALGPSFSDAPLPAPMPSSDTAWAMRDLRRFADPALKAERRARIRPTRLDPDLASNRSMSLSVKMLMQADRDFERSEQSERTYLERVISGWWNT